ncbi:hypothetical protein ACFP63_14340 [Oerskovia jenensis]|uniref:Antirestriction protein ArdA n=1 Tax=Oerskovia jenensis TaxID=162169 RepID=A0ABS2L9Y0_9CELL|nr:hypothetical protein [Oerskovia jenensis]MBM7477200.1 hypothetical protein [Oerskovia jenensis]
MPLTDDIAQLLRDRLFAQEVWLSVLPPAAEFDDVARATGLTPIGRGWTEVGADGARQLLTTLLRIGIAHADEIMPEHRARRLAEEFIGSFGERGARYATNCAPSEEFLQYFGGSALGHAPDDATPPTDPWFGSLFESDGWNPATEYTFDTGLVVLGESSSGCYWVAEED